MKEIFLDLGRCNGCLSCAVGCVVEHSASKTILGAMMEIAKPRINVESMNGRAVPVLCRHCEEPACVDACMAGAMQKDKETCFVTNEDHEQSCVGCWMCVMACPYGAVFQQAEQEKKALKCDRCPEREIPACVEACPNEALLFAEPDSYSETKRRGAIIKLTEFEGCVS